MKDLSVSLEHLEMSLIQWLARYSIVLLRIALGIVFLAFGLLKFFPNVSPVESLVVRTTNILTFGLVPPGAELVLVALMECAIGFGLLSGKFLRLTLLLLGLQLIGAMSPLVFLPTELFGGPFHAPTLEGQYVIKDVVLVSAGLVIATTLHGGRIVTEHVRRAEDYSRYGKADRRPRSSIK